MPATAATVANLIRPQVSVDITRLKFINRRFLDALMSVGAQSVMQQGSVNHEWNALQTGNTSARTFVEGAGAPATGSQAWQRATIGPTYWDIWVELSGIAADQLGSRWSGDEQGQETVEAIEDLWDLVNTTLLGAGAPGGIQLAIDSAGTYAALNRAVVTEWQSVETAIGGAMTLAALEDDAELIRDNDRGGTLGALIAPWNQVTNYMRLAGASSGTAADRLVRYVVDATKPGKQAFDYSPDMSAGTFQGVPVLGTPDMTDTVVLLLSNIARDWKLVTFRPITERERPAEGDSIWRRQISLGMQLVCHNPRVQGKETGVTA